MADTLRVYLFESVPEGAPDLTGRLYHATILNGQVIPSDGAVYLLNTATVASTSVPQLLAGIRKRTNGNPIEVIPNQPYPNSTAFIPGKVPKLWEHRRLSGIAPLYEKSIKSSLETR